ncbi:MAG: bifunctional enoyl-CoA hydratase/phosphate acetyltransferase [Defluviitaleaceae bacterium]|nr:bifunctional enoyl-CoA hydratase/phosphate acetyltransferase [Defluviitaleaceae bacterium]
MYAKFDDLQKMVQSKKDARVAVASAQDKHSLEALRDLREQFDMQYMLVGDGKEITRLSQDVGLDLSGVDIIEAQSEEEAAADAVALVKKGEANLLMKGKLQTATLLKAVLNKETGIRHGTLMSHIAALESPAYDRLMYITDGGINPAPDYSQKKGILLNAIGFLHKLGYESPNVAALAAVEKASEKVPGTQDAFLLGKESETGEILGCTVEGPISFDLAISKVSAKIKGFESKIAGETDIFLAPDISSGNILAKALQYLGNAKMAGCVIGAKVPIILTSRGATAEEKYLSFLLALAAI